MLQVLAGMEPHPESVPINALVARRGNAAGESPARVEPLELVRMVATTVS